MESERKSKGIIIGVLCAVIVFMSIGFAALSSQLTINANATNTTSIKTFIFIPHQTNQKRECTILPKQHHTHHYHQR